jgi:hypothetical protein
MGRFPALKRRAEPSSPCGQGPKGQESWSQALIRSFEAFDAGALQFWTTTIRKTIGYGY